jgi:hypothetical protein
MKRLSSYFRMCRRLIGNVWLDLRYGGFVGGTFQTPYAHLGVEDTANTDYAALPFIFTPDAVRHSDVLVDIGCGKGRVVNWWLSQGYTNQIVGIEIDERIAWKTKHRLRRHKNVTIICGNALANLPRNGTIFYLFNPFKASWVAALKVQLESLFATTSKPTIFYYNCVHIDIFRNDSGWDVEEITLPVPFHRCARMKMKPTVSVERPSAVELTRLRRDQSDSFFKRRDS